MLGLLLLLCSENAWSHELTPAYFSTQEIDRGVFEVVWKLPLRDGTYPDIDPIFSVDCVAIDQPEDAVTAVNYVRSWRIQCSGDSPTVRFSKLETALVDVFIASANEDGLLSSQPVRDASPVLLARNSTTKVSAYLLFGVEHILTGHDHLMFVLGLLLLMRGKGWLIVISAFTVGHSLTLAGVALGVPAPPSALVEMFIAFSIVLLATEALRSRTSGPDHNSKRLPMVALAFGLLHGFGFAGALTDFGLAKENALGALLLFNLGVEVGQIAFVLVALGVHKLLAVRIRHHGFTHACYVVGGSGSVWAGLRIADTFF
ncbi:MAG: HupE/UreJ family protein [Pseudomonadota bacterium]